MRPFEGIRILDFSRVVSAPYATYLLGLLGAEVIKVEDRSGDTTRFTNGDATLKAQGLGSTYMMFNAGKLSVTLDLKKPDAIEIVEKLVKTADVVVENFRPGVMDRLGIGYEQLARQNPEIIYCAVSGFGQTGPDAGAAAFDGNVQAASGMMDLTGLPDGGPLRTGYTIGDTGAGMNAALAISAALYQRNRTKRGQFIDVSMLDTALSLMAQSAGPMLNGGIEPTRRGNLSITREPTSDVFQTASGHLMLAIIWDKQIETLLRVTGLEALIGDPRFATRATRIANAAFIHAAIQTELRKATAREWEARLDKAGVPCSRVLKISEALSQSQVQHRQQIMEFTDTETARPVRVLNAGFSYTHGGPGTERPPQRLGAQNRQVLEQIGYSDADIEDLARREVI